MFTYLFFVHTIVGLLVVSLFAKETIQEHKASEDETITARFLLLIAFGFFPVLNFIGLFAFFYNMYIKHKSNLFYQERIENNPSYEAVDILRQLARSRALSDAFIFSPFSDGYHNLYGFYMHVSDTIAKETTESIAMREQLTHMLPCLRSLHEHHQMSLANKDYKEFHKAASSCLHLFYKNLLSTKK